MQPHTAGFLCDSVEPSLTRCRAAGRLAALLLLLLLLSPPGKAHSLRLHHPNPSLPTADISQGKPGPVFLSRSLSTSLDCEAPPNAPYLRPYVRLSTHNNARTRDSIDPILP
jgi:hypothetical protein